MILRLTLTPPVKTSQNYVLDIPLDRQAIAGCSIGVERGRRPYVPAQANRHPFRRRLHRSGHSTGLESGISRLSGRPSREFAIPHVLASVDDRRTCRQHKAVDCGDTGGDLDLENRRDDSVAHPPPWPRIPFGPFSRSTAAQLVVAHHVVRGTCQMKPKPAASCYATAPAMTRPGLRRIKPAR